MMHPAFAALLSAVRADESFKATVRQQQEYRHRVVELLEFSDTLMLGTDTFESSADKLEQTLLALKADDLYNLLDVTHTMQREIEALHNLLLRHAARIEAIQSAGEVDVAQVDLSDAPMHLSDAPDDTPEPAS